MTTSTFLFSMTAALSLACGSAAAQSFTFLPRDTVLSGSLGGEMIFECTIRNVSAATLTLGVIRTSNQLPAGWTSSMCFDACFPPTIDSIATTPDFGSSPIAPDSSRAFSLHVYPLTNMGTGTIRIVARNLRNPSDQRVITFTARSPVNSVGGAAQRSTGFALNQNYPNPFNPGTRVEFQVPGDGLVRLSVFDLLGREVVNVINELMPAGHHTRSIDASTLPSGVYFYRLTSGGRSVTHTMTVVK